MNMMVGIVLQLVALRVGGGEDGRLLQAFNRAPDAIEIRKSVEVCGIEITV